MYKIITGEKWKPRVKKFSKEMREALKHINIIDAGTFKAKLADFVLGNEGNNVAIYNFARDYLTKGSEASKAAGKKDAPKGLKASTLEEVIDANRKLREFHLTGLRNIIKNAKPGAARIKAIKAVMRHLRMQTDIGNGIIKGTATVTSVSSISGAPSITANPFSKNFLGTIYHEI